MSDLRDHPDIVLCQTSEEVIQVIVAMLPGETKIVEMVFPLEAHTARDIIAFVFLSSLIRVKPIDATHIEVTYVDALASHLLYSSGEN